MLALVCLTIAADPLLFVAEAASFRAKFPTAPEHSERELTVGTDRTVPLAVWKATGPDTKTVYSVTVADYPPAFADVPADVLLDGVRDGLKGRDGKIIAEERPAGKYPTRAVRIVAGKNTVRTRLILVGTRLYQVTVSGPTRTLLDEPSLAFFDSFKPTPR